MSLLAVPNVSEGRRPEVVRALEESLTRAGARLLDTHSDASHNRSVFTLTGTEDALVAAAVELAAAAMERIDLRTHRGVHPRLGVLDVWPFVPYREEMEAAVEAARRTATAVASATGLPVYLYGAAARRAETAELPALRRGGLDALVGRAHAGLAPDEGPQAIDPARGVVCIGARGPLIAFNVWLRSELQTARRIASAVRGPAVRALGLPIDARRCQVSMNLVDPARVGIDEAFSAVAERAGEAVIATEIVGLVEERFLPDPDAQAARLLLSPGRSVEAALSR